MLSWPRCAEVSPLLSFLPSFHALHSIHSLSPLAHLCGTSFERHISKASKGTGVLFGRVSLLRQNKASLVIQSTRPLAPSLEAIPMRSLIIRQGRQLINSSSTVSPLCFLMAPAYVLDAVWLGCSACWDVQRAEQHGALACSSHLHFIVAALAPFF